MDCPTKNFVWTVGRMESRCWSLEEVSDGYWSTINTIAVHVPIGSLYTNSSVYLVLSSTMNLSVHVS